MDKKVQKAIKTVKTKAKKKEFANLATLNKTLILIASILLIMAVKQFVEVDVKLKSKDTKSNKTSTTQTKSPPVAQSSDEAEALASQVIPAEGYTVNIKWGDVGKKLVSSGAIDLEKYKKNYSGEQWTELMSYLTSEKDQGITINRENAYFWVNTLWALGLVQRSDVLTYGVMGTEYKDKLGNFASTGGWTLGSKDAVSLYSSTDIVTLTADQQKMVEEISKNIYRPCCGNPTSFPDCNHGMAILGLIELMASQGYSEEEIYRASLYFNSYWFVQTYMDLAYYFQTNDGLTWDKVDPKKALSAQYSSAQGYQALKKEIGDTPKLQSTGGSCGA